MSALNPTSPAFETATPNDHGVSVTLVNCVLAVFSGLVVISRAFVRLRITKLRAVDDVAIALALVCTVLCGAEKLTDGLMLGVRDRTVHMHATCQEPWLGKASE